MWKMIMKLVSWLVLIAGASSALAGPVIVNQGMSSADTFALRDRLARWPEQGGEGGDDLPAVEPGHAGRGDAQSGQAVSAR